MDQIRCDFWEKMGLRNALISPPIAQSIWGGCQEIIYYKMKTYDQDTDKVGGTVKMTGSRPRGPYCPNSGSVLLDTDVKRQRPRVSSQFFPRGQGPGSRAFPRPGALLRVLRALFLHSSGEAVPSWGLSVLFGRNAQCCPCALPPPSRGSCTVETVSQTFALPRPQPGFRGGHGTQDMERREQELVLHRLPSLGLSLVGRHM